MILNGQMGINGNSFRLRMVQVRGRAYGRIDERTGPGTQVKTQKKSYIL